MRATAREARILGTVAGIRALQMRAAEGDHLRAEQARRAAGERLAEGRAAVRAAEQGWAEVTARGRLDPALSQAWLHELGSRRTEAQILAEAEAEAAAEAEARRTALAAAQARAAASSDQAAMAARAAARRREEARLAAVEDRLNASWKAA
jgi:hypothetical protein